MRTMLFVMLALIAQAAVAQLSGWQWQTPWPQGNDLNAVWAFDSNNAVAVGDLGTIIRTTDGGNSWLTSFQTAGAEEDFTSLYFIDSLQGWCVGWRSLLKTTNGGITWERQIMNRGYSFRSVVFADAQRGWLAGDFDLLRTTDGGNTWDTTNIPRYYQFTSMCFINQRTGWVATYQGIIFRTTDAGISWTQVPAPWGPWVSYNSIWFVDSLRGWAGGMGSQFGSIFISTTDGGNSWAIHSRPYGYRIKSIHFADSLHGWVVSMPSHFLFYTSDGGITWDTTASIGKGWLNVARSGRSYRNVWTVGNLGVIALSTNGGASWVEKSVQLSSGLGDVKFANRRVGWAVGDTILKTTNGGATWVVQRMPQPSYLRSLFVLDSLTAWCAGGEGATLFRTTDGGANWVSQYAPVNQTWFSIFFSNERLGWVSGRFGALRRTTDGGEHWDSIATGTFADLGAVFFHDSLRGWMVGNSSQLLRTTNGGLSWSQFTITAAYPHMLWDVFFLTPSLGWIAGEGVMLKTTDAGSSWTLVDTQTLYRKVRFVDVLNGWAAGNGGVFHSTDGGRTWLRQFLPASFASSVAFVDRFTGWAVAGGGILHTTTGGTTSIENRATLSEQPSEGQLSQNYPNPFNPTTSIGFRIADYGFVSLKVVDVLGREVATLVNEVKSPGKYEAQFDASNLSSGVYFYQLRTGKLVSTKKMLLIR
jgi:photosystem II stability/assembly factor-like uncharacterized protein